MAAIAKEQFRRTGDDRFLRRYESICKTFNIAPEDVERHEHSGSVENEISVPSNVVQAIKNGSSSNLEQGGK